MTSTSALSKSLLLVAALFLAFSALVAADDGGLHCNDGSDVGSNGCCSDTGGCPSCCLYSSVYSSGCMCTGCTGADVVIDTGCTYSFGSGLSAGCKSAIVDTHGVAADQVYGLSYGNGECQLCFASPMADVDVVCMNDQNRCMELANAVKKYDGLPQLGVENGKFTCNSAGKVYAAGTSYALRGLVLAAAFAAVLF